MAPRRQLLPPILKQRPASGRTRSPSPALLLLLKARQERAPTESVLGPGRQMPLLSPARQVTNRRPGLARAPADATAGRRACARGAWAKPLSDSQFLDPSRLAAPVRAERRVRRPVRRGWTREERSDGERAGGWVSAHNKAAHDGVAGARRDVLHVLRDLHTALPDEGDGSDAHPHDLRQLRLHDGAARL